MFILLSIYHACDRAIIMHMIEGLPAFQRSRRYDLPRAVCLVSSADRCSVSSVRACVVPCVVCPGTCPALVLARPALLPVLFSRSGCAGGCGLHRRGIWGEPGVGQVMPAIKFFKEKGVFGVFLSNTHPTFTNQNPSDCASLQKFRKTQKGPSRSLDCAIIS